MENVKYIPGDLVKINGKTNIIDGIYSKSFSKDRVIEAYAIEGDNTNRYRYDLDFGRIVSIKPILLTSEILEKNGWIKESTSLLCKQAEIRYSTDYCSAYLEEDAKIWEITYSSPRASATLKIKYCHELQHLLLGLGLDSSLKV